MIIFSRIWENFPGIVNLLKIIVRNIHAKCRRKLKFKPAEIPNPSFHKVEDYLVGVDQRFICKLKKVKLLTSQYMDSSTL